MRLRFFYLIFPFIFGLTACLSLPLERPQDLSLQLDWNTGALPPRYHYSYSIRIDSQGNGEFDYHPGYKDDTKNDLHEEFSLSAAQMDALYQYLLDNKLIRSSWETDRQLIGGKGTSINIVADGKEYTVPSVSELRDDDRDLVYKAIDYINSLVPDDIWEEKEARQKAFEDSYSENE